MGDLTYPSDNVQDVIETVSLRLGLTRLSTFLPEIMLFLTSSSLAAILDRIFTNDLLLFSQLSYHAPFSNSDHNCISCSLVCNARSSYLINSNFESSLQFVYRDADLAGVDSFLSRVNWSLLFQGTVGINECGAVICQKTNQAFSKFIPNRLSNFRINAKHLKRYPKHIRTLYNKRHLHGKN